MDRLRIILTKYFIIVALTLVYIGLMVLVIAPTINHVVFGQETKAPPAVVPTPVNTPTPTQPNPNLQYLPQKAYVQAYAPENGIPQSQQPLQVVPQVVTQPVQSNGLGIPTDMMGYIAAAGAAFAYFKGHIVGKKADKNEQVSREQSAQIVKGAEVDQSLANQVYNFAPEDKLKAMEGTAPEIKLSKLAENKEEAVKTASKA